MILLLASVGLAHAQDEGILLTEIHVVSQPRKARIYINGKEVGFTPLLLTEPLDIGDNIQAFAYGFNQWEESLTAPVFSDTLRISLHRKKARLRIQSDQLDMLGADIKARFVDQDTLYNGFINIGRGDVTFEADIYVGKYQLEISKPGFTPLEMDLIVPPQGRLLRDVNLSRQPPPLASLSVDRLRDLAELYHEDCLHLFSSALAIGEDTLTVRSGSKVHLYDSRLTPFLVELESYSSHARELEEVMQRTGSQDLEILQYLAQIYAYRGIVLGKYRRFEEAQLLFQTAHNISPFPVRQEPNPLPRDPGNILLGDLMEFSEEWYNKLGRVDVEVNSDWLVNSSLKSVPLFLEAVSLSREPVVPAPSSVFDQGMRDSLILLASHKLRENIDRNIKEFSLVLPKGYYYLRDQKNLAVPHYFLVEDPTTVRIDPRVDLWLPVADSRTDTVYLRPIDGRELGPVVTADQVAFGQEYELLVDTGEYKRFKERVVFYKAGDLKPIWPGVTAISAKSGVPCEYFKDGSNELQGRFLQVQSIGKSRILRYLAIPVVLGGLLLFL